MKAPLATVLGAGVGALYFWYGEANQEKESNCSYLAPASTDFMAMGAALYLIYRGNKAPEPLIACIGGAIAAIHTGQYLHFKAKES